MTTLKDFVDETLSQITAGVEAFEKKQSDTDVTVKPLVSTSGELAGTSISDAGLLYLGRIRGYATLVSFDIAIEEEEDSTKQANADLKVAFVNAGGFFKNSKATSTANRIKFTLPLQLMQINKVDD